MNGLEQKLFELQQKEITPIKVIRDKTKTIYDQYEKGGILRSKILGQIIKSHLPGNSELTQTIWDTNNLLDISNAELYAVLKKLPTNKGTQQEKQALKGFLGKGNLLYHPIPSLSPKTFFQEIDWPVALDYWLNGGTSKDTRLVEAFKSSIIPLPLENPSRYQPLNNHQIWVTNSGTGKSTFNLIYGNSPTQEITTAGLFGANVDNYNYSVPGILSNNGMFMIDEVSELTVTNKNEAPLVNLLLAYLEQGHVTRTLKKSIICKGTKTIILNSNPQDKQSTLNTIHKFINIIGGHDDKIRIGRRFGLFLFGNDFKTVDLSQGFPLSNLQFLQRMIRYTTINNYTLIHKLLEKHYLELSQPDEDIKKELLDIAKHIDTFKTVSEFLQGCALSTSRIKMAAFRSFLLDNLPTINKRKSKELSKTWNTEKSEYISKLYDINLKSFIFAEQTYLTERDSRTFEELIKAGYTQAEIAHVMKISQPMVNKYLKQNESKNKKKTR